LARPTNSSIVLGGSPAAATRVGLMISVGMPASVPARRPAGPTGRQP
jgi:hypothetical protein